jgi:hypothetical protein
MGLLMQREAHRKRKGCLPFFNECDGELLAKSSLEIVLLQQQ